VDDLDHVLDAFVYDLGGPAPDGQGSIGDLTLMRLYLVALAFDVTLAVNTVGNA
jgi:hypothetical protein